MRKNTVIKGWRGGGRGGKRVKKIQFCLKSERKVTKSQQPGFGSAFFPSRRKTSRRGGWKMGWDPLGTQPGGWGGFGFGCFVGKL